MARRSESAERGLESQASPHNDPEDVFADDNGYADSIAESFADSQYARSLRRAPSIVSQSEVHDTLETEPARPASPPRRPSVPQAWSGTHDASRPYRGSLRKSLGAALVSAHQDESLPRNHPEPPASPTAASTSSGPQRASSFASTSSMFAMSQSPFQSASHPYGSYPQEVGMSRTASIATSNSPINRSSSTRQGPTHPYNLYPQNVQDEPVASASAIPVGFPGHVEDLYRRVGPDGEPVIIGADGHAEELPPYSRYPEEPAAKTNTPDVVMPPIGETQATEDEPLLPEPEPPFFPREPHDFLRQPGPSRRSAPPSADPSANPFSDQHAITNYSASTSESEKSWKQMTWKERRKARVFGCIPVWLFVVLMILLLIFATISGGVIGSHLQSANDPQDDDDGNNSTSSSTLPMTPLPEITGTPSPTPTTTMIDAKELFTTPSAFPPLPTGLFKIDVSEATSSSQMCLKRNDQRKAWSCSLEPDAFSLRLGWNSSSPFLSLYPYDPHAAPQYGAQPPEILGQTLKLAKDLNDPELGTAFQFQVLYNKLVIVENEVLSPPDDGTGSINKRDDTSDSPYWESFNRPAWSRKSIATGETPWFCFFNSTLLEGFVYVQNDTIEAASALASSSMLAAAMTVPPSAAPSGSMPSSIASSTSSPSPPPYQTDAIPTPTNVPSSSDLPHSAATLPALRRDTLLGKRDGSSDSDPLYPKRIKLVERRLWAQSAANVPYCQKMTTSPFGVMKAFRDNTGSPVIFYLSESDPPDSTTTASDSVSGTGTKRSVELHELAERGLPNDGCFCQWQWM